ncbi:peroxisomal biogenesis factor 3-like isoform X2 [Limulus polyphemus]|uniref:Peroxisomal biogenesis factor 3 n=1 Tax=Limulus polyphemus TaxID=6850 RepID=A0ABM1SZ04_LIMPO|nr:peroxisomal biogenesis factor 3-like isoform X2 [Limulus polyphemus]
MYWKVHTMFKKVCRFIRQHQKKILVGGGVMVGVLWLNKYLHSKLVDFEFKRTTEYVEQLKKQQHFEGTLQTCDSSTISLVPKVWEHLLMLLDFDQVLDMLKIKSGNKLQLWEELKINIISYAVCEVYATSLFVMFMRVQLSVIGGYMYVDTHWQKSENGINFPLATAEVQQKYLACIQHFLDIGVKQLVRLVSEAVKKQFGSVSLKDNLFLKDFHSLLQNVKLDIAGTHGVIPKVSEYLLPDDPAHLPSGSSASTTPLVLSKLLVETSDILESPDFVKVLSSCVDQGYGALLDKLSECYFHINQSNKDRFTNPYNVNVPLAKVIPVLKKVLQDVPVEDKSLFTYQLLQLELLKSFSANIYEAFSQSVEDSNHSLNKQVQTV